VHDGGLDWAKIDASAGVTSILLFPDVAAAVAPSYFSYLRSASSVTTGSLSRRPLPGAPVFACALDSLLTTPVVGIDGMKKSAIGSSDATGATAARAPIFFPAVSAFSASPEAWELFLRWQSAQIDRGSATPVVPGLVELDTSGSRDTVDSGNEIRAWFSNFVHAYGGHVLYPVVPDGELLVDRNPLVADDASSVLKAAAVRAGAAAPPPYVMRLATRGSSDLCCSLSVNMTSSIAIPARPQILAIDGMPLIGGSARDIVPLDDVSMAAKPPFLSLHQPSVGGISSSSLQTDEADRAHGEAVEQIADFARTRGVEAVSFTLVTGAFVETTYSWICNVLAIESLPKALVLGASDANVVRTLQEFFEKDPRVAKDDVLVVDLGSAIRAVKSAKKPHEGIDFGSTEYWLLMLERTALLRDVLDAGIGILHFETDQIWFADPMLSINTLLTGKRDGRTVDMVLTINTRNEASGNFFFLGPSLATRHLWAVVTTAFQESYRKSLTTKEVKQGKWHYIDNDQSLLTRYALGHNKWYNKNFPLAEYAVLDKQRFVDGTWYLDFEDEKGRRVSKRSHYTSEESKQPYVLNNNFMIGVAGKKARAQRFGHWFYSETTQSCNMTRGSGPGQILVRP
jgi:Nucleotide-diphospho-sugar transferase